MNLSGYFFRVEHDLLRSDAFKTLGGSAVKVYLVIGLYSDFGTDWAFPSIRTIAHQAGLSRQTVLTAIDQLTRIGLIATSKSRGRSTAYRIIRQAPQRPPRGSPRNTKVKDPPTSTGLFSLDATHLSSQKSLEVAPRPVQESRPVLAYSGGPGGQPTRPKGNSIPIDETTSIPIPGTPFRLTAEGRLEVAVDLQELLTNQGIPGQLAQQLVAQKDPEAVAKVLLNAFYLQSQGKLQNGAGYIRTGIEDGYELLPQVASRLEAQRHVLRDQIQRVKARERQLQEAEEHNVEQAVVSRVLAQLSAEELDDLVQEALVSLPQPLVRRNPTLSNPFVRTKVFELVCDGRLS
jgi:hypothetical protein